MTIDARLDPDAETAVISHVGEALCLGITVLTGAADFRCIAHFARRETGAGPT